ncbi:MAG: DUF4364 family protein [Eubacteriales bacterium]|nr:DUF4364 family protein [Eubacteriales bacterium]
MESPFTTYKLIVLYMLKNTENPLTNSQISEFILDHEYTNYFNLQQAISELVEVSLIKKQTIINTSYYQLTEDGQNTLSFFENELSAQIRDEVIEYLKSIGIKKAEPLLTPANYYPATTQQDTYTVRCQIVQKNITLFDISFNVPGIDAAKAICLNWPDKSQEIYESIIEKLL